MMVAPSEQEVQEVEQIMDEETGLDLTNENVEKVRKALLTIRAMFSLGLDTNTVKWTIRTLL
eukprot:4305612-Pyramimonas_sp.AAC.1